ncbi:MAG: hypothetical protein ACLQDQ_00190 [Myxococcaceae bacterium]
MRAAFGVGAIGFGLERFGMAAALTRGSGLLEFVAGILVFTPLTALAATFLGGWWLLLAVVSATAGSPELGVCDILLAAGAFALARLTRVNEAERSPRPHVAVAEAPAPRRVTFELEAVAAPEAKAVARAVVSSRRSA